MEDVGIRRGIVISNDDPESRGRCKIFVPGIYPEEFSKTPENLPWAEPAMSLFGGGWKSNTGKKNNNMNAQKPAFEETGICSVPHAGINGDGAQVWVFFDNNDIRRPVYFAVAQTGPGWFSKHNNQHVIVTDNVKVIVDEYDSYSPIQKKNDNVSNELAGDVSNRQPQDVKNDISNIGGVSEMKSLYDGAGGTHKAFDFMNAVGGSQGLQKISDVCSNGLNSLSNFVSSAGGADSLRTFMTNCGGIEGIRDALNGTDSAAGRAASKVIQDKYGSINSFKTEIAQVGGVEGLREIINSSDKENGFFDALESIGGNNGLSSLATLESKLGGSSNFKEWNDGFKDGANGVDALVSGKSAEDKLQEIQQQSKQKEDETITKSTTYTTDADGYSFIKSRTERDRKTRLKIQIEAKDNMALDLSVKGDVNVKIDGNLYREITGNIYDTILGDHHIYRKQGIVTIQDGNYVRMIGGKKEEKVTQEVINLVQGGEKNIYSGNIDFNFCQATVNFKTKAFSVDAESTISLNAENIYINGMQNIDLESEGDMSIGVSKRLIANSSFFGVESQAINLKSLKDFFIEAVGTLGLRAGGLLKLITKPFTDGLFTKSGIKIITDDLLVRSRLFSNFSFDGTVVENIGNVTTPAVVTKTSFAAITDTLTGNLTKTNIGNIVENIGNVTTPATVLKNVIGSETHTVSTTYSLTSTGIMTLTGAAGVAVVADTGVSLTGSAGTVVFTGATATVVDTPTGTGGGGTFAVVVVG